MPRKPKFKPVITRVKLNPEQAVLSCNCYYFGVRWAGAMLADPPLTGIGYCNAGSKITDSSYRCVALSGAFGAVATSGGATSS